jgi:hypothetical protein
VDPYDFLVALVAEGVVDAQQVMAALDLAQREIRPDVPERRALQKQVAAWEPRGSENCKGRDASGTEANPGRRTASSGMNTRPQEPFASSEEP